MSKQPISELLKFTKVSGHETANTTGINSTGIDMQGYYGVMFITSFGTAANNNTINAAQGDTLGGSYDDLEDTEVSSGTSDEDVWIDIPNPKDRYVRLEATRGTSTTLESVWAIQYGAFSRQAALNVVSGTIIGEIHIRPDEGTK